MGINKKHMISDLYLDLKLQIQSHGWKWAIKETTKLV